MNLTNNFPTFKGTTNDKPIKFIKDFEFRVPSHIRNNDNLLLETVQQVLSDGALTWFGQLQQSTDRVDRWIDFKSRFYQRYHTTVSVQSLRTELQLLFQGDKESTLDYFDRLKTLLIEIDPDCSEQYIKRKFVQKMRSDIRSRFDVDINLSTSELVRKAQNIESNIEQQKIDEKLKSASQEKKHSAVLLTNNLSTNPSHRFTPGPPLVESSTTIPNQDSNRTSSNHHSLQYINPNHPDHLSHRSNTYGPIKKNIHSHHTENYRKNFNHHSTPSHSNNLSNQDDRYQSPISSIPPNNHRQYSNLSQSVDHLSSIQSNNNHVRSSTNSIRRYWCPHCQRNGHSWERCPSNPQSINYRTNNDSKNSTGR